MKFSIASFLLLLSLHMYAQDNQEEVYDTAKRIDPYYSETDYLIRNHSFQIAPDSSMLFIQQYDQTKKDAICIQNLGDVNTPFISLLFKPYERMGAQLGLIPFTNLYRFADQARFYNALLPYTEFQYAQGKGGQRGMIDFDALHTQNFGKGFNITAAYHSTSNDGFYSRQSMSCKNIQVSSYYRTPSNRYTATVVFTWNKTNTMENGGIEQSAETEAQFKELGGSVRVVPVSLNQARNINRLREHSFRHVYWLIMETSADTNTAKAGKLGISHSFSSFKQSNYYTDASSDYGFYDSVFYFNSYNSYDTSALEQISNSFELFSPIRDKGLSFKAGIRNDRFSSLQKADAGNFRRLIAHNNSIYGQILFTLSKRFRSEVNGVYYFEGYNSADYQLKWINKTTFGPAKQWAGSIGANAQSRRPFLRDERMVSNHYIWDQTFRNTNLQSIQLTLSKNSKRPSIYNAFYYALPQKAIETQLNYILMDGYMYYDNNQLPQQSKSLLSVIQGILRFHLSLKQFQYHQDIAYQIIAGDEKKVIQLPSVVSKSSLYYQNYAFKKASFIQIGIDANFCTEYSAGLYNPGIQNFSLSNKKVGAYPYLDFFINAEVKTARIFLKLEHFNQDLISSSAFPNYFFVSPYQPSAPRRLRLGFIWKFYY